MTGIDLSAVAIEQATEEAERQGVADRCEFRVMNAEELDFADDSFDLICGTAILHHLDLDKAYSELRRTMPATRSRGPPEPRRATTRSSTPIGGARPSTAPRTSIPCSRRISSAPTDFFGEVETEHFHLSTLAAVPFRGRRRVFRPDAPGALHHARSGHVQASGAAPAVVDGRDLGRRAAAVLTEGLSGRPSRVPGEHPLEPGRIRSSRR